MEAEEDPKVPEALSHLSIVTFMVPHYEPILPLTLVHRPFTRVNGDYGHLMKGCNNWSRSEGIDILLSRKALLRALEEISALRSISLTSLLNPNASSRSVPLPRGLEEESHIFLKSDISSSLAYPRMSYIVVIKFCVQCSPFIEAFR